MSGVFYTTEIFKRVFYTPRSDMRIVLYSTIHGTNKRLATEIRSGYTNWKWVPMENEQLQLSLMKAYFLNKLEI